MSKLSDLFGRKGGEPDTDKYPAQTSSKRANGDTDRLSYETTSGISSRMGEQNEALRSLLGDAGRKIGELDELKNAFDKIVEPFNSALRALEVEKSQNLGLKNALSESQAAYDTLRKECYDVEKKATALEIESERLRDELEFSREAARGLENSRAEIAAEVAAKQAQIAELERQLAQESAQRQLFGENAKTLADQRRDAEQRIVELEGELAVTREKLALSEDEKRTMRSSLDQTLSETARLTRRLTESENSLAAIRGQLTKMEASYAEVFAERGRLAAAHDEAREQHQAERTTLNIRLDGLQSRAATAEKLLAETRQNLMARTEEMRSFDRKAVEATIARNNAEKKLAQIESAHEARERQIKDLEQSRTALVERTNALGKTLKMREAALGRAEEKIQALTGRIGHLEADIQVSRTNIEKRVEQLNSALQREGMERAMADGALEAARKDNARLQDEVAALRSALRRGLPLDEAPTAPDSDADAPKSKKGKSVESAAAIEPIVKA